MTVSTPFDATDVHVDLDRPFVIEVEVRGRSEQILWTAERIDATEAATARLSRFDFDPSDPVAFLTAVRGAFGDPTNVVFLDVAANLRSA